MDTAWDDHDDTSQDNGVVCAAVEWLVVAVDSGTKAVETAEVGVPMQVPLSFGPSLFSSDEQRNALTH